MTIYIFTLKEKALKNLFPKNTRFISIKLPALKELSNHDPESESLSYIDISGFSGVEIKKVLVKFQNCCRNNAWGIIDPKGSIVDPVSLLFDGAHDYLGPSILKEPSYLDIRRFKNVLSKRQILVEEKSETGSKKGEKFSLIKNGVKLPPETSFPGWKKIRSGKTFDFYLLYCSLKGNVALDSRLGEKNFAQVHQRFISILTKKLSEAEGLCWMNSGKDCLFLLPPKAKCIEAAVEASIKMIAATPIIVIETLNITVPVNITFALHYGAINYSPPGQTGTVISDAVNFIFHLGTKKAESGRLSISGEIPETSVPKLLEDLFTPVGEFEGRKIWHTKKFTYGKPWG